ncbi:MAG TPA: hypothetical protein VFH26_04285 [Gemmatimonadales bacterium]|nr:hypothetical protein [Gemmatimonadales bacterium]
MNSVIWLRVIIRYGVVLLGAVIAGSRAVTSVQSWQRYREWAGRDPSAADAYLNFAASDAVVVVLSVSLAGLVWWLLRPKSPQASA